MFYLELHSIRAKKSLRMGDTFDIRYLQNFLVSNHAVTCSLPFLHLRFTLSRFVSLHILKEFIYYMYVVKLLSLKFVRFS